MYDQEIEETKLFLEKYLSTLETGCWTIENACVSARNVSGFGLPADAQVIRVLVEEPDQGWSVAIEAAYRARKPWRVRIARYYDDHDAYGGPIGVARAYVDWLAAL